MDSDKQFNLFLKIAGVFFLIFALAIFSFLYMFCKIFSGPDPSKHGFIDKTGKIVIPMKYNMVKDFSEGLAAVSKKGHHGFEGDFYGKWGYINKKGDLVIPYQYEQAGSFSNGKAIVLLNSKKNYKGKGEYPWVCIDKSGNILFELPPGIPYHESPSFRNGFIHLRNGYVDEKGTYLKESNNLPMILNHNFSEGLALVATLDGDNHLLEGFIDISGEYVISPTNAYQVSKKFSEGLALINVTSLYGFINKNGEIVIEPVYCEAESFHEGLAAVSNEKRNINYGNWGYIDREGEVIIPFQYDFVREFSEGLAYVKKDEKAFYINTNGEIEIEIPPEYWGKNFSEGLAVIVEQWNRD